MVNQVDISRCLQRILNINHLSFSRNTGAPAFALDHFALPLFCITQCLRALTQKGIKSGTIIHSFASSTSSGLTHFRSEGPVTPDFAKRQHAHHEHAAHGRGRSGAHGPADTAKVCPTVFVKAAVNRAKK